MNFKQLLFFLLLFSACQEDIPLNSMKDCNTSNTRFAKVVILVVGQSNAANFSNKVYTSYCENTFNFHQGNLSPLKDPLKGANGTGGSVWTPMAMQLMERNFAQEIIIAPAAIGGSSIEQWIPGGDLHYLLAETVDELAAANLRVSHVLWHQGESNHSMTNPSLSASDNANAYKANLGLLLAYLRSENVTAPFFVATATRCGHRDADPALQNAQQTIANDSLQIFLGPNTDLLDETYRYDNCHFNREGIEKHATMWADILMAHP